MQGHNSMNPETKAELRGYIERIENVEDEIGGLQQDKRDIFAEAKSRGYDTKAIRKILKIRKMEPQEREEAETILDSYLNALGMIPQFELPLDDGEGSPA